MTTKLDIWLTQISSFVRNYLSALALADSEHLGFTYRAYTLGRWPAILHSNGPGICHLPLRPALHAVSLHRFTSFLNM